MKQKYIGVYKCRLCGESFTYGKTYSANRSIARVAMANAIPILFKNKTSGMVHCCKDGSIGICDLQGFSEKEIKEKYERN